MNSMGNGPTRTWDKGPKSRTLLRLTVVNVISDAYDEQVQARLPLGMSCII